MEEIPLLTIAKYSAVFCFTMIGIKLLTMLVMVVIIAIISPIFGKSFNSSLTYIKNITHPSLGRI